MSLFTHLVFSWERLASCSGINLHARPGNAIEETVQYYYNSHNRFQGYTRYRYMPEIRSCQSDNVTLLLLVYAWYCS